MGWGALCWLPTSIRGWNPGDFGDLTGIDSERDRREWRLCPMQTPQPVYCTSLSFGPADSSTESSKERSDRQPTVVHTLFGGQGDKLPCPLK